MTPLMTSYETEEIWIPPKSRLITYEKADEDWCRYFGIGEVVTRPKQLYDIRRSDLSLAGYLTAPPKADARINIPAVSTYCAAADYVPHMKIQYIFLQSAKIWLQRRYGPAFFYCWRLDSRIDELLIQNCREFTKPGNDNLDRYISDSYNKVGF